MSKPISAGSPLGDVLPGPPLVYRRRMTWSDTDAARIVYTVRFFEFAMAAVESWFREIWGIDWFRLNVEHGMGTPFVHLDMDLKASLVPEDVLEIPVRIERLGTSAITFDLAGRKQSGVECFRARYVCTLAHMEPAIRSAPIPDQRREAIEAYMAECEMADGGSARSDVRY